MIRISSSRVSRIFRGGKWVGVVLESFLMFDEQGGQHIRYVSYVSSTLISLVSFSSSYFLPRIVRDAEELADAHRCLAVVAAAAAVFDSPLWKNLR